MLDVHLREINCNCMHILLRESYFINIYYLYIIQYKYTMICIVESAIESIQNKNTIILRLFATHILHIVDITIIFNLVIISIK